MAVVVVVMVVVLAWVVMVHRATMSLTTRRVVLFQVVWSEWQ